MTWYTRAPHAGWYVLLTMAICILLAAASGLYVGYAKRTADRATAALDSIAQGRWEKFEPGDVVIAPSGRRRVIR